VFASARATVELRERYPWLDLDYPSSTQEQEFSEQWLSPGDVLFLPAGTYHRAEAEGYSLALTLACVPMTAADFVDDAVRGNLGHLPAWRASIPPSVSPAENALPSELAEFFAARLGELRRVVNALRPEDLYETWAHHVASLDTPLRAPRHAGPARVSEQDHFRVLRTFPLRCAHDPSRGSITLYYLDNRLELSADCLPMIQLIQRQSSFSGSEALSALGGHFAWKDVAPILELLVSEGALQRAEPRDRHTLEARQGPP
jgi:hypothetical protein